MLKYCECVNAINQALVERYWKMRYAYKSDFQPFKTSGHTSGLRRFLSLLLILTSVISRSSFFNAEELQNFRAEAEPMDIALVEEDESLLNDLYAEEQVIDSSDDTDLIDDNDLRDVNDLSSFSDVGNDKDREQDTIHDDPISDSQTSFSDTSNDIIPEEPANILDDLIEETDAPGESWDGSQDEFQNGFLVDSELLSETGTEEAALFFGDGLPDSDDLLEGFIEEQFEISSSEAASRPGLACGDHLTGVNKKLYDVIKAAVIQIAEGERTSTIIEISPKEAGMDGSWTAADLNVSSLVNGQRISQEAREALNEKFPYDLGVVLGALLQDLPYHLYWYDKTETGGISYSLPGYSLEYGYFQEDKISYNGNFRVVFYAAQEYAGSSKTKINSSLITSIKAAKENALNIVHRYSSCTDFIRLTKYKEEICSLVSYNQAAASPDVQYGNPWQAIWVFDGDPSTNVVCEGYAKAFQYLCDMSDFIHPVSCSTVTGDMKLVTPRSTSSGGHMWNVVTMGDGLNYLVDITNCDAGTIGAHDQLFMKGYDDHPSSLTYIFQLKQNSTVTYVYDEDTWLVTPQFRLELSSNSYDPSVEDYSCTGGKAHRVEVLHAVEPDSTHTGLTEGKWCPICENIFIEQQTVLIPISLCCLDISEDSPMYDGRAKTPDVIVTADNTFLQEGRDYKISFKNNTNAGIASVIITGCRNYTGTLIGHFEISRASAVISGKELSIKYSSKKRTVNMPITVSPNVKHTFTSSVAAVKVSSDGKVTVPAGYAGAVKITVKTTDANYVSRSGSWLLNVLPKAPALGKVQRTSKTTAQVRWKKAAKATSYQIQFAENKAFSKSVGIKTAKAKKKEATLTGLKKGKVYYARIRTVVKNSSGTVYSAWSKAKKIKK